jgi:hypothetical protein
MFKLEFLGLNSMLIAGLAAQLNKKHEKRKKHP